MTKSRDLPGQVKQLIMDLFICLQNTWPSKQFRAELMLGAIHLELLRTRLVRANGLEEWRSIRKRTGARIRGNARGHRRSMADMSKNKTGNQQASRPNQAAF